MRETSSQNGARPFAFRQPLTPGTAVQVTMFGDNLVAEQHEPLSQAPLRQHATHAWREAAPTPASAHAPEAPGPKTQHEQLPLAHEDSVHLANNGVRIRREFECVR